MNNVTSYLLKYSVSDMLNISSIAPKKQEVQKAAQPAISSSVRAPSSKYCMNFRGRTISTRLTSGILGTLQKFNVEECRASSLVSSKQVALMKTPLDQILNDPLTDEKTKSCIQAFLSFTKLPPNQILANLPTQSLLQFYTSYLDHIKPSLDQWEAKLAREFSISLLVTISQEFDALSPFVLLLFEQIMKYKEAALKQNPSQWMQWNFQKDQGQ